jgi:peptidoglycan/LPS O-acetylase OafA/YrhL
MGHEASSNRFLILDGLRGILALIVALGHLGMPPLFGPIDQSNTTLAALARSLRTFAFGPPAVIAFFVISGFCIHFSFADRRSELPVFRFYARRYLRIGVPLIAISAILLLMNPSRVLIGDKSILWNSTLWSILCEEIYYAIYPILLLIQRRIGLVWLMLGSSGISLSFIVATFPAVEWTELGILGTSAVLLPIWLLGVSLAQLVNSGRLPSVGLREVMVWRAGAWVVMWLALMLHFHGGFPQTANGTLVGIYAFFWLRAELAGALRIAPSAFLVWFGAWSYSLYLMHPVVIQALHCLDIKGTTSITQWLLSMVAILLLSYAFYVLIEAPSHRWARRISLRPNGSSREPLASSGLSRNVPVS